MEPKNLSLGADDGGTAVMAPALDGAAQPAGPPAADRVVPSGITTPAIPLRIAAGASALAGVLHYAAVPEHRAEWWAAAVFFTALAAFEIIWAAQVWSDDRRPVLWLGAVVNAATVALWAVSRSSGLPFGPDAGTAEDIGVLDVACVVAELVTLAALLQALLPGRGRRGTD